MVVQTEKGKKRYFQFLLLFMAIVIGFLLLCVRVWVDRHNPIRVELNEQTVSSPLVDITVNVTKTWNDVDINNEPCVGAQYDAVVHNKMNTTLINWEMLITLPEEATIDSSWNGQFVMTGNEILFRPEADLDIYAVKADATESFGMVMISDELLNIRNFLLVGYRDAKITDYLSFYILLVLTVLLVIVVACYTALEIRTRNLEQQRLRDQKIILETMQTIADFIDAKDEYTKGHSSRVSKYSIKIAEKMKLSEEEVRNIGYIALMHDCGKMGIPDYVLNKPGRLSDEEMEIMRTHTVLGGKVLHSITTIEGIREGALYHHERFDGKGYPEGLSGESIPLCARIIGVADSFDAMNSDRCYRKHLAKEKIIEEFETNFGKQFDPEIAKLMVEMLRSGEIE